MAQPASKVKGHLGPLLRTLEAFLATWGVPLCMFMHFYQVFVNTCAFSHKNTANCIKYNEYCTKTQKKCLKVRKNARREAKNGPAGLKSEPGGPKWVQLGPLLRTLEAF